MLSPYFYIAGNVMPADLQGIRIIGILLVLGMLFIIFWLTGVIKIVQKVIISPSDVVVNVEAKIQAFNNALNSMVTIDANNKIIAWNKKGKKMFGWDEHEVIKRDLGEVLIPIEQRAMHIAGIKRYIETGESKIINTPGGIELKALKRDGSLLDVRLYLCAWKNEAGFQFFGANMVDITKEKALDAVLFKEIELYRQGEVAGKCGVAIFYILEDITVPSPGFCELFDMDYKTTYNASDFISRIHHDDRKLATNAIANVIETNKGFDMHYRVVRKDLSLISVESKFYAYERDEQGKVLSLISYLRNIGEAHER